MLIIIGHHFTVHGDFSFFPVSDSGVTTTLNLLWLLLISMGGKIGVDVFTLISGYFLIASPRIRVKKALTLWVQIFFYSIGIYALFLITNGTAFSLKEAVKTALPILSGRWWFASAYFMLYLMSPFLNHFLRSLPQNTYQKMLVGMFVCWSVIPTLTTSSFQSNNLIWFVCLYSLAAYVRLWGDPFSWSAAKSLRTAAALIGVTFLVAALFWITGCHIPMLRIFAQHSTYLYGQEKVTILGISFFLMMGFKNLKLRYSRLINKLASATFGVYLIHDNNLVRPFLWRRLFRNAAFTQSPYLIPYSCAVILTVYVICSLIEFARAYLMKRLCGEPMNRAADALERLTRSVFPD